MNDFSHFQHGLVLSLNVSVTQHISCAWTAVQKGRLTILQILRDVKSASKRMLFCHLSPDDFPLNVFSCVLSLALLLLPSLFTALNGGSLNKFGTDEIQPINLSRSKSSRTPPEPSFNRQMKYIMRNCSDAARMFANKFGCYWLIMRLRIVFVSDKKVMSLFFFYSQT